MGRAFGFITVLAAVGIGAYLYMQQVQSMTSQGTAPNTTIDVTAVRNDLLAIANAERRYWATNAKYASLDELSRNGDIAIPVRPNYAYSANVSDAGFTIVATYTGSDPHAPRLLTVDQDMATTAQ